MRRWRKGRQRSSIRLKPVNAIPYDVRLVGREREPVVTVEGFSPDPDRLRRLAAEASFAGDDIYYPGVKAPISVDYFNETRATIAAVLREVFDVRKGADVIRASYSIVTTPPHELSTEQRMPHVDSIEPGALAILHYIAPGDRDGTAFYRHRSTQFETLDAARSEEYFKTLNADILRCGPPPPAYICGDTPLFEKIGHVDGAYNRALIYRGRLLHSGAISAGRELPADPLRGRLTIASFLAAE